MRAPSVLVVLAAALYVSSGAFAFNILEGPKWDLEDGPVGYVIDPAGSDDVTGSSDIKALKHAFKNWECVLCSSIQFRYDGDAPARAVGPDGHNTLYFVEDPGDWPLGPGTLTAAVLGVCTGGGGPDADIIFNGVDHSWSTTDPLSSDADIESIAVHEIGHLIGLGHPCTDESETDCLSQDVAVMNPVYPGGITRDPLEDDRAGICELYPPGKDTCEGGLVIGQACQENCECERDLRCVEGEDGKRYCAPLCAGDAPHCPKQMACLLAARHGAVGVPAEGACVKVTDVSDLPPSAACDRDSQCASDNCGLIPDLGRTACVINCADSEQCPDRHTCLDSRCVLNNPDRGVPCPDVPPEDEGCQCSGSGRGTPALALLLIGIGLLVLRRRVRGPRWTRAMILSAALIGLPLEGRAAVVAPLDLGQMVALADVIVHGEVEAVTTRELEPGGAIFTVVEVRVLEALLGAQTAGRIEVWVMGGQVGDRSMYVPGSSTYRTGEEVVLLLSRWRQHLVQVAVGVGKFRVQRDRNGQLLARESGPAAVVPGRSSTGSATLETRSRLPAIPLADLKRELKARIMYEKSGREEGDAP